MSQFNPPQTTSEAHAYIKIEEFINLVLHTSGMPFHIEEKKDQILVIPRLLSKDFHVLTRYWNHFNSGYDFEVHVQLYWDACKHVGFIGDHGVTEIGMDYNPSIHVHAYAVNDLVRFIRSQADTKEFKRRAYDKKYQASEKCSSMECFISEAMTRYCKSLVVRVDLEYTQACTYRKTIADMYDDIDAFLSLKDTHEAFEGLVGYAVALEQGTKRGYHAHFVAIVDGNKFRSEWHRGELLRALWCQVVGIGGTAHICQYHPEKYGVRGVGHFRRDKPDTHQDVIQTAQYLTEYKEDQHLRAKPKGRRVFRTFLKR